MGLLCCIPWQCDLLIHGSLSTLDPNGGDNVGIQAPDGPHKVDEEGRSGARWPPLPGSWHCKQDGISETGLSIHTALCIREQ